MIPGNINTDLISGADEVGYQISRSLRFNSADSAYLSRTPASAGNRKTWTWAGWVKRSGLGTYQRVFNARNPGVAADYIRFNNDNTLELYFGATLITAQVFRDVSSWYHLTVAVDTTQATSSNRVKLYVNGTQVTTFATTNYPSQNADTLFNATLIHNIGTGDGTTEYFSGYLADIHFIDGQALTPSSFAETNATTGQWVPKAYTGSYGTNGFRLDFSDNSAATATTLGKDRAGSNNWTPNNLSVTAGAGNDSLVDTPTSYGTDTGAGGEVRGNYCTLNPLDTGGGSFANGNLEWTFLSGTSVNVRGTMAFPVTGKWYFECVSVGAGNQSYGITSANTALTGVPGSRTVMYADNGLKYVDGTGSAYGATYAAGDVVGVAYNADLNQITFYKNNVSQGAISTNAGTTYFPFISGFNSSSILNFGQRPFAYTAPSGFKALCDTNLPAPVVAKPNTVMDVVLRTGTGTSGGTISSLNFSADFIWSKLRSASSSHYLLDSVRGIANTLQSNSTASEASYSTWFTSITSTGYTVGSGDWNSGTSVVEWCWDAGSSTVTNTQGSITTSLRASPSSGFSVATWSGTGSGSVTVGHGLGVAPRFMIIKDRSLSRNWLVYHTSLGASSGLTLNSTTAASGTDGGWWNHTAPTSTVATIGTYGNEASNYVGYFWTPVAGYSSFGSYVGNGTSGDGVFVYTGFRVRWLLIKQSSAAGEQWFLLDSARSPYNVAQEYLCPSASFGETSAYGIVDFLSNGFKLRATGSISSFNGSGATYIYCAFAESPLQYTRAR